MKNIFTILIAVIFSLNLTAQDAGFVHTATADNIEWNVTNIDHPLLNGNPDAKVLFVQRYNGVAENNNPTGIGYSLGKWAIYNENSVDMPEGIQFNIYIADDSTVSTHIADVSNTSLSPSTINLGTYTSDDWLFQSNYWNGVLNSAVYGNFYYAPTSSRYLYTEDGSSIPLGSGFKVMNGSALSATRFTVISNPGNISGSTMTIDHPALNDNPDAVFLFSHYWVSDTYNVLLPNVTEAWYNTSTGRWRIFKYGGDFPENVWFDFIVPDGSLGIDDTQLQISKISLYPNPVEDEVTISSSLLPVQAVEIYDVTGKLVQSYEQTGTNITLNVSALQSGLYLVKVKTEEGWFSQKLIKK